MKERVDALTWIDTDAIAGVKQPAAKADRFSDTENEGWLHRASELERGGRKISPEQKPARAFPLRDYEIL